MTSADQLKGYQAQIEKALQDCFTDNPPWGTLYRAMRYSLLAGGKRIRPVLALACCKACGGKVEHALPYACGIEMIHTYSLIHDDLPCMDNDDYRRGKPTCHKVYGQAMATLAGDGLLTAAFGTVSGSWAGSVQSPRQIAQAVLCLATAAGEDGMVAGQVMDLEWEGRTDLSQIELEQIHDKKTGALLRCACQLGCIAADGTPQQSAALQRYASALGMAFQIRDDILDVYGDTAVLGKPVGSDADNGKTTFVTLLGLEKSQALVQELTLTAKSAIADFEDPDFLCWLADMLVNRQS